MKLAKFGLINKNQRGVALLSLMIALAISGIIMTAATMTTFQVINSSGRTSNHMFALRQVQNAGYWISYDVQMAQSVEPAAPPDADGLPLTLTWSEYASSIEHQIVYDLVGDELIRSYSINGGPPIESTVAEFIVSGTNCEYSGGVLTFTVVSTVGAGSQEITASGIYEIIPRPSVDS
jgi:type II secretory pathway pseudopilin PulG